MAAAEDGLFFFKKSKTLFTEEIGIRSVNYVSLTIPAREYCYLWNIYNVFLKVNTVIFPVAESITKTTRFFFILTSLEYNVRGLTFLGHIFLLTRRIFVVLFFIPLLRIGWSAIVGFSQDKGCTDLNFKKFYFIKNHKKVFKTAIRHSETKSRTFVKQNLSGWTRILLGLQIIGWIFLSRIGK